MYRNCDCSFPAKIRLQVFNRIDILTVQVGNRLYIILCALTVNSEERRIYYKEITRYVGIGTYALKRADIREAFLVCPDKILLCKHTIIIISLCYYFYYYCC